MAGAEESEDQIMRRCHALMMECGDRLTDIAVETEDLGFARHDFVTFCLDTTAEPWASVAAEIRAAHRTTEEGDGDPIVVGALPIEEIEPEVRCINARVADVLADRTSNGLYRFLIVSGQDVAVFMEELIDVPQDNN